MKTISLSTYNRPDVLSRMLDTLKANNTRDWTLMVSAEPGFPECVELVKRSGLNARIVVNDFKMGNTTNTFLAPFQAFAAGSTFNLYLEDDLLLSPDTLDLCNWYISSGVRDREVGLVLWRAYSQNGPTWLSYDGRGGNGNGFGCTREQWADFWRKEWFSYGREAYGKVWDIATDERLRALNLRVLSPFQPRSVQQLVDGTHVSMKEHSTNPLFTVPIYQGVPIRDFEIV